MANHICPTCTTPVTRGAAICPECVTAAFPVRGLREEVRWPHVVPSSAVDLDVSGSRSAPDD